MVIILKNILGTTRKQDIENFIAPVLKGGFLRRSGRLINVSIVAYRDIKLNVLIYHGLVDINPDSVAERVIKKLNRKAIKGKYIGINEYHIRNWRNDPRSHARKMSNPLKDKRICDRRNLNLEIEEAVVQEFTSSKTFHRILD
ncbi:MAG: hypothetical protein ACXW0Q_12200 [Methylovulum sp.]